MEQISLFETFKVLQIQKYNYFYISPLRGIYQNPNSYGGLQIMYVKMW